MIYTPTQLHLTCSQIRDFVGIEVTIFLNNQFFRSVIENVLNLSFFVKLALIKNRVHNSRDLEQPT